MFSSGITTLAPSISLPGSVVPFPVMTAPWPCAEVVRMIEQRPNRTARQRRNNLRLSIFTFLTSNGISCSGRRFWVYLLSDLLLHERGAHLELFPILGVRRFSSIVVWTRVTTAIADLR